SSEDDEIGSFSMLEFWDIMNSIVAGARKQLQQSQHHDDNHLSPGSAPSLHEYAQHGRRQRLPTFRGLKGELRLAKRELCVMLFQVFEDVYCANTILVNCRTLIPRLVEQDPADDDEETKLWRLCIIAAASQFIDNDGVSPDADLSWDTSPVLYGEEFFNEGL